MSGGERRLDPPPGGGFPGVDGPSTTAGDEPLNDLAAAMRRVIAVAVGQPLREEHVTEAATKLAAVADRLEAAAREEKRPRNQPFAEGHPQDIFSTSPVIGFANPVAPPVEVWAVEGENGAREVRGRVTFGYAYEGPPTCVHGGVIAELFDELLGMSNILSGQGAMTGTLTIRYRRPTPLLAPLQLAARHTGKEGRKVFAWGGIYCQGELTAEAEGIFIEVPPGRMLDIVSGNAHRAEVPLVDPDWQRAMARDSAPARGHQAPEARHEAEAHVSPRVVDVQVHQHDGLPGPQRHPAPEHGHRHRRAHEGGQDVIGPVARRSMRMAVAGVAGEESVQRSEQVGLGSRAGLHQGHAGGGVRHEHVDQPVAQPGAEALELGRQVDDALAGGVDTQLDRLHRPPSLP